MRWGIIGGAALLLAACGRGPPEAETNDTQSSAAASEEKGPAAPDHRPTPGSLATFGDWAVGCDNAGTCKAASLAPEEGDFPDVLMSITRAGGPGGATTIAFLGNEAMTTPLRVAVDGRPVATGGRTDEDGTRIGGDAAWRIAAAAADGRELTVADGAGNGASTISLKGLAAALRSMDANQGRAGTTGALVARGPAADTRAAPKVPVVTAPAPGGVAATPSPLQLARFRQAGGCDEDIAANTAQPFETHALGGGTTLLLLPCSAGPYNVRSLVYVSDGRGFRPAEFDSAPGTSGRGEVPDIVNGLWENGLLTTFDKARGLGDCGVSASHAWDGSRFRLIEQAAMEECRGNTDYIRTWTAELRRR